MSPGRSRRAEEGKENTRRKRGKTDKHDTLCSIEFQQALRWNLHQIDSNYAGFFLLFPTPDACSDGHSSVSTDARVRGPKSQPDYRCFRVFSVLLHGVWMVSRSIRLPKPRQITIATPTGPTTLGFRCQGWLNSTFASLTPANSILA